MSEMDAEMECIAEQTYTKKVWVVVSSALIKVLGRPTVERLGAKYLQQGDYHWRIYYHPDRKSMYQRHVNHVVKFFSDKGGTLLDVGCGDGLILSKLSNETELDCFGIDISPLAIALAHRHRVMNCQCVDLFKYTANNIIRRPMGLFDYVFIGDLLEHLPDPELALNCVKNFLADGGYVLMAIPIQGQKPDGGDRYIVDLAKLMRISRQMFGKVICLQIRRHWKKWYILARKVAKIDSGIMKPNEKLEDQWNVKKSLELHI